MRRVARTDASAVHYCLRDAGFILLDDETPIRLTPHTLVIVAPGRAMTVAATEHCEATEPLQSAGLSGCIFTVSICTSVDTRVQSGTVRQAGRRSNSFAGQSLPGVTSSVRLRLTHRLRLTNRICRTNQDL